MIWNEAPKRYCGLVADTAAVFAPAHCISQVIVARSTGNAIAAIGGRAFGRLVNAGEAIVPESTWREVKIAHLAVSSIDIGRIRSERGRRERAHDAALFLGNILAGDLRGELGGVQSQGARITGAGAGAGAGSGAGL